MSTDNMAKADVVAQYQKRLQAICAEAKHDDVVLEIRNVALFPLAMGNHEMHPLARARIEYNAPDVPPQATGVLRT